MNKACFEITILCAVVSSAELLPYLASHLIFFLAVVSVRFHCMATSWYGAAVRSVTPLRSIFQIKSFPENCATVSF